MKRRVALMGIVHESNTFVETQTDIRRFEEGHWCFGNDIITDYRPMEQVSPNNFPTWMGSGCPDSVNW